MSLRNQFRLFTNGDKYRLKQRQKKFVWSWVKRKLNGGSIIGKIAEFDTIADAHYYLLENFASSVEEEVWTIVEDIDLEVLANSTNGAHE